jgi:hypothetical protein
VRQMMGKGKGGEEGARAHQIGWNRAETLAGAAGSDEEIRRPGGVLVQGKGRGKERGSGAL